ncbi:MAG TPA: hypothetical protein VLE22_26270 [Bryobacteraceae bacterium]|nr:hypothetical protein [Bryobacteraceae bacterium]
MKVLVAGILLAGVALPLHGNKGEEPLRLRVFMYNYAETSQSLVDRARRETSMIFRRAGVEIEWVQCTLSMRNAPQQLCSMRRGPANLELRLLPRRMAGRMRLGSNAAGFALQPLDGVPGVLANVFPDHAADLATNSGLDRGVMLGHLIAHELGHLLLGIGSHSTGGMMAAPWGRRELSWAMKGCLTFSRPEAEKIRSRLLLRSAGMGTPNAAIR